MLETFHVQVEGYVISDNQIKPAMDQSDQCISEVDENKCMIVLGMSTGKQRENWVRIDEHVIYFLRNNF